jgi:hypothetical protein
MAAKPAVPFLARSALALAALALLGGCAQYSDADACADLSTMVWPWQGLESPQQVTTVPLPGVPQIAAFPAYAIQVSGALDRPADTALAGSRPVAVFQCEHRGDLLHSFGWVEPDMLARPELRINRVTAAPTS